MGAACRGAVRLTAGPRASGGDAWAVTPAKVQAAIERIVRVAQPRRVFLFGSYVRGDTGRNSDLDILVVTDDSIHNPRAESVRIRRCLRDISMPMDILVITEGRLRQLADVRGLVYHEILRSGQEVYESSSQAPASRLP